MANSEHVELLLEDVNGWNLWRSENEDIKPDCSGADLGEANLKGADFNGANLTRANLDSADFTDVHIGGTILGNANLTNAKKLESCIHHGSSIIDHQTMKQSGILPAIFLRGCGLPESLIDYYQSLLNTAISFYSCFISYSHADKAFARRLHDELQHRGIRCWLDEHQLLPGHDIYKGIDRGIRLWDKVLLCASENSLTSWWVDSEINKAFKKEQQLMKRGNEKVLALIPLNMDNYLFDGDWVSGKEDEVKSRLAADFTGWEIDDEKFEHAFENVVKALTTDEASREKPPKQKL